MTKRGMVLAGVGVALAGIVAWSLFGGGGAGKPTTRAAAGSVRGAPTGPAPEVVAGLVQKQPASLFQRGVGAVRPIKSVQILPQVEGPIVKVAFSDGQTVKAGDVLFEIDPRPYQAALAQAEGQRARDEADLASARRDLDRTTTLAKNGNATGQALDQNRSRVGQLEAALKIDDGKITQAKVDLERCSIRAPIDGRIGAAQQTEGNIVRPTQTTVLTVINMMAPIEVQFTIPQDRLLDVQAANAKKPLTTYVSNSEGDKQLAQGELVFIDNRVEATTGTVALKSRFQNLDGNLWPGQFVTVSLEIENRAGALIVDSRAIQTGPNGRYVYVIKPDYVIEARPVKVAVLEELRAIIDEGVSEGERVVIDGQLRVVPNGKVRIRGEAAPPAPGKQGAGTPEASTSPATGSTVR